ncbi:MAG: hypothetical protein A3F54_00905 [Candidatus Kerfeldbacteria bacterium RIFCSPHIGHO2_12_FULL_48_17]|uniref:Outer membrane protein beta-barrel domain-containing protein n=1 Tax=Candidatus Kerfeldbacteria bacterium RIFCSPHIGHO2_12_FULL_48_17 TaxID=1798542 RepID=A0A1G2B4J4_9BACT|nr:MAG: hypothetical protein A3F54_00905 [Candidatus Kerfeldbacteria bacterium RIFCSPHIGHO2_12_FULL_48_17]
MQKNSSLKKYIANLFSSPVAAILLLILAALMNLVSAAQASDRETQDAYEEGYPLVQYDWNTFSLGLGYNSARGPVVDAGFMHRSGAGARLYVAAGYGSPDAGNKTEAAMEISWQLLLSQSLSFTAQGRIYDIDARDLGFVDPAIVGAAGGFLGWQTWLGGFSGGLRYNFTNADPGDFNPYRWAVRWDKFVGIGGGVAVTGSFGTELADGLDLFDLQEASKIGGGGGIRWFLRWFSGAFWRVEAGSHNGGYAFLGIGYSSSGAQSYIQK